MKSAKTFVIALLALAVVGAGALAWKQYEELVGLRAELLDGDAAILKKQLADARKSIKALQDRIAALRRAGATDADDQAGGGGPGGPDGQGNRSNRPGRGGWGAMSSNPEFQKLMALQMKGRLDQTYGSLYKTLNLSPQQLQQFQSLLAEKQQAMMDVLQAARAQGLSPRTDPQGFNQLVSQAQSQVDSSIQQVLGDAGFQQYQQYQQTLPERNTVNSLTQQLSYTQTPLTDDQAAQMVSLLAQAQPQKAGNGTTGTGTSAGDGGLNMYQLMNGGGTAKVTTDAVNLAAGVLSAPQVQVLESIQKQQQAQQQMQQMMRASQSAGAAGASGGATGGTAAASGGKG
jgi:hypothetical protein